MAENKIYSEDDVNLSGARAILIDLLRIFFEILTFLGRSIRKNKFFITLALVAGLICGYVFGVSRSSHYKATMIVQFNKLTKRTFAEMVEQLNHLISYGETSALARQMEVSDATAGKLLSIEARDMDDKELISDTSTKIEQPFKIIAVLGQDNGITMDSLQAGVLHYLNYSPLLTRLADVAQKHNKLKLQIIDSDLVRLDSLKREYNHSLSSARLPANFYNSAANPAEFYAQTLLLLNQRELALKEVTVNRLPLEVIDSFTISSVSGRVAMPSTVFLFSLGATFLAILISIMIEARNRIMPPVRSEARAVVIEKPLK